MNAGRVASLLGWILPCSLVWSAAPGAKTLPPLPPPHEARPAGSAAPPPGVIARASDATTSVRSPALAAVTNRPAAPAPANLQPGKPGVLEFDATNKHVDAQEDERKASFVFAVTNRSAETVTISYINTSCGCTAGKLPANPWILPPGEGGHIDVTMDLTGKVGKVTKTATVVASTGSYPLTVSVSIPVQAPTAMNRSRNLQVAGADRQAVFRNDCAACHTQPAMGKMGRDLYEAACGICHEAEHRASMVPDLRTRLKNTDRNYWAKWITDGRAGSLMPAFASRSGGILSDRQIASLVDYLEDDYKKNPPPSKFVATPDSPTPASPGSGPSSPP